MGFRLCLFNANACLHSKAKKIAAGFAILIGFYYLMISGAAVSTQCALIMVSFVMPVISLILSSLVAGSATAPFSVVHFNQVSHYVLLANILSLPVMGFLVVPSAVLPMMLMPFGAEAVGLWGWILAFDGFWP